MKQISALVVFFFAAHCAVMAIESEFFRAVGTIMHDAPNGFRNVKGKQTANSYIAIVWECNIPVPGVIASRFVYAKGSAWEGALLQTRDSSAIRPVLDQYTRALDSFLNPMGYKPYRLDNFYPGLENFKKIAFLMENNDRKQPHLALEVTYLKDKGLYTVILYIYEH